MRRYTAPDLMSNVALKSLAIACLFRGCARKCDREL
jgi:hypothetical protein